jgi:hypothetical protein
VSSKHVWEVQEVAKDKFKTVFPTLGELRRMIEWGTLETKDRKAKMEVKECGGGSSYKQAMKKVWI